MFPGQDRLPSEAAERMDDDVRPLHGAWRATLLTALTSAACRQASGHTAAHRVPGGDHGRGRGAILASGCGSCHIIPYVRPARALVGPSLDDGAERRVVAGLVPNDPERLMTWLTVPQSIQPGPAMPGLDGIDGETVKGAACLYTLH